MLRINGLSLPTDTERIQFLKYAKLAPHLAVDTESDPDVDLLLGISVAFPGVAMYFPVAHLEEDANITDAQLKELIEIIKSVPLRIFHHAAHDLEKLREIGYDLWYLPFADTMIMTHMIDENIRNKGLDYLHKMFTSKEGKNRSPLMQGMIDSMGWRYVPVTLMDDYAKNDALITEELFTEIRPLFEEQYGSLYEIIG